AAPVVAIVELVGGIALIAGAFTGIVGLLLAIDMLVAALLVHLPQGVFIDAGGGELVGALGAGALAIAVVGAGRLSLDALLRGRRASRSRASSAASAAACPGRVPLRRLRPPPPVPGTAPDGGGAGHSAFGSGSAALG